MAVVDPAAPGRYSPGMPSEYKPVPPEKEWLTADEVAMLLSVHPETVREWLRRGRLKGRNLGRGSGWRVARAELDRFMQRESD